MLTVSIVHHPVWEKLAPYLHLIEHGHPDDPQVRVEFLDVPEIFAAKVAQETTMPCVHCQRVISPLRRRITDPWSRLYYAPTCELSKRVACSRSRAAMLEYERMLGLKRPASQQTTLAL